METPVLVPDSECPRCRELEARLVVLEAKLRDLEDVIRALKGGPPPQREGEPIAPPAAKTPTGKKPGGQKGHKPHKRPWLPKERVTATVAFVPTQCEHGDHALPAAAQPGDPAPTIHQTYELPQQLIDVTQYEGHSRTCPGCLAVTHPAIPAEHRTTILGARLSAMILHHTGVMGLSKRDVEETLETVFDLPISLGTIANLERAAAAALEPIHRAIRAEVDRAPVKGLDETGWKQAGKKRWLWVAATAKSVFFRIHPRRDERRDDVRNQTDEHGHARRRAAGSRLPSAAGLEVRERLGPHGPPRKGRHRFHRPVTRETEHGYVRPGERIDPESRDGLPRHGQGRGPGRPPLQGRADVEAPDDAGDEGRVDAGVWGLIW